MMRNCAPENPFLPILLRRHGFRARAFRAKQLRYFVATAHPGMTKAGCLKN
jgi:hypothetical protein